MRILHYIRALRVRDGGVVRAVMDLCTYQSRAGHDVTVACCAADDAPWAGRPGEPRVVVLPTPRGPALLDRRFREAGAAEVGRCDVLHLHVIWDPAQVALARAARRRGRPYVVSTHGMLIPRYLRQKRAKKAAFMALFGRRLLGGAAFVHSTAESEAADSRAHHPGTPSRVIPLLVDLDVFRRLPGPGDAERALSLPSGFPRLVHMSLMLPTKRPALVIEAGAALRARGLDPVIVMAGPASERVRAALESLAAARGLSGRVVFPGMITDLKASLLQAGDVFLLPSKAENFALAAFESLACGTPVVTTRATATWRELEASGGALAVPRFEDDASAFVAAVAEITKDCEALRARGASGRRWVLDSLEPARVVERYIEMYASALQAAGAGRVPGR
jgi:glycosyltransferase involved in cell wall biosynthesis